MLCLHVLLRRRWQALDNTSRLELLLHRATATTLEADLRSRVAAYLPASLAAGGGGDVESAAVLAAVVETADEAAEERAAPLSERAVGWRVWARVLRRAATQRLPLVLRALELSKVPLHKTCVARALCVSALCSSAVAPAASARARVPFHVRIPRPGTSVCFPRATRWWRRRSRVFTPVRCRPITGARSMRAALLFVTEKSEK